MALDFITQAWADGYRDGKNGLFIPANHAKSAAYVQGWRKGDYVFTTTQTVNAR